jgi:hypothetical protein
MHATQAISYPMKLITALEFIYLYHTNAYLTKSIFWAGAHERTINKTETIY